MVGRTVLLVGLGTRSSSEPINYYLLLLLR
jgi:hypothetical protein